MSHPLFNILVQRPDLVVNHLFAYGALVKQETAEAGIALRNKLLFWGSAVVLICVSLGLAGVALMLGAVQGQFHWVFVAVPCAMLFLGCIAVGFAIRPLQEAQFSQIKRQLDDDLLVLRTAASVRN